MTRIVIVGVKKVAIRQGVGPGPARGGIVMGQPTIVNGGAEIGTGVLMILTLGFGDNGLACPP